MVTKFGVFLSALPPYRPSLTVFKWKRVVLTLSVGLCLWMVYSEVVYEALLSKEHQNAKGKEVYEARSNQTLEAGKTTLKMTEIFGEKSIRNVRVYDNNINSAYGGSVIHSLKRKTNAEKTAKGKYLDSPHANRLNQRIITQGAVTSAANAIYPFSLPGPDTRKQSEKTVLLYTNFFYGSWDNLMRERMKLMHLCPISNCRFIFNSSHPESADAVIFHAKDLNMESVPKIRRPEQLYIWLNMESPQLVDSRKVPQHLQPSHKGATEALRRMKEKWFGTPDFFNWTFTYHRSSDLLLLYGGLLPLRGDFDTLRPGLLNTSGATYKAYTTALDRGDELQDDPSHNWSAFLARPKLAVWMASHCGTSSGREFYVKELQKHLKVDVFGLCGDLRCGNTHADVHCYSNLLGPTYKFYLAFENNLCEDYVTEKVWLPLHYGLVPVVYGGARYAHFLPPHSYVDATSLTPFQLARLLTSVASSSQLYGRYHLWRNYWTVLLKPPLCEICHKLHHQANDNGEMTARYQHHDLMEWWLSVNNCSTRYPHSRYPRPSEPASWSLLRQALDTLRVFAGL